MAASTTTVLSAVEAETLIELLKVIPLKDIGNERWRLQHEYLEKLNMQAILSASANTDEFIPEGFASYNKVFVVIHDLLSTELWQNKVFPLLLEMDIQQNSSLPIYMAFFHEATALSLLETLLYHKEPCECAGEAVIDLVDYCCRKITQIIVRAEMKEEAPAASDRKINSNSSVKEELETQCRSVAVDLSFKALSVLRYIADHLESLPLSVMTRLLNTHDVPCLLVQVLDISPWRRTTNNGKSQVYVDREWKDVASEDSFLLPKLEGQVWLTLYHLLLNPDATRKYEFTNYRKNQVLKLRKYLNESLLDQIPVLVHLQKYLQELSIMESVAAKRELILEQVPEIRENIEKECDGRWEEIAEFQLKEYFSPSSKEIQDQAKQN
ncbi:zinc finger MYND domain-containing protein 10-like isoform X2 [Rhopilema esculentum]|uniref:zinc finger MYND domain-containing protein 10-like isoform X2 n=1 Tax=Rhopilema esculentum TaxID=499914 RepID=UPI0031D22040